MPGLNLLILSPLWYARPISPGAHRFSNATAYFGLYCARTGAAARQIVACGKHSRSSTTQRQPGSRLPHVSRVHVGAVNHRCALVPAATTAFCPTDWRHHGAGPSIELGGGLEAATPQGAAEQDTVTLSVNWANAQHTLYAAQPD